MSLYLDSSLLVSLIARELFSSEVEAWLEAQAGQDLASSAWVTTEVSSALSIKLRTKEITLGERSAALARFRAMSSDSFIHFAVFDRHFAAAARYCDDHELGLRAGDAVHLAIAADNAATVCTRDVGMAAAGLKLGIPTMLIHGRSA